jgi:hypothetical protein
MNRKLIFIVIAAISGAACSATPRQELPSTPEIVTETAVAPTATATRDPNMPADATGQNSEGRYSKEVTEDGSSVDYEWVPELKGWFKSLMFDGKGIPLLDYKDNSLGWHSNDLIPLYVYMAEEMPDTQKGFFLQHQNLSPDLEGATFSDLLSTDLARWHYATGNASSITQEQWQDYSAGLQDDDSSTVSLVFTTSAGESAWSPGPRIGYKVYLLGWDNAAPSDENGFSEWNHPDGRLFRSKVYIDPAGNLVSVIASQTSIDTFSDKELREMFLFRLASLAFTRDQSWQGYVSGMGIYFSWAGEEKNPVPYIEIVPMQ